MHSKANEDRAKQKPTRKVIKKSKVKTHHEQEQQQHQQKQQGFCDWGRCNGPTLELFWVPPNDVLSGPVLPLCDVPRSRHPDGNSDTLQDILMITRTTELWVIMHSVQVNRVWTTSGHNIDSQTVADLKPMCEQFMQCMWGAWCQVLQHIETIFSA